ncbi:32 kDa beta-galactoside-binding lectin-like [Anopheles albimanus]|uniref:Galectin n=1 Tax=Anopheles albimanus TaxID=7167 RepID=A0A182F1Z0_ANOAL|nr:32 kDa beta-galactoside-binding lectin-like [Anopheles albimanus]
MAVLLYIALSIGDDLLALGSALYDCRGSWTECRSQLALIRKERQFESLILQRYPPDWEDKDDEDDRQRRRRRRPQQYRGLQLKQRMSSESLDSCDYAYPETIPSPSSISLDKSSSTEVVYTLENIREVAPGLCFVVTGTVLLTCERFAVNLMLKNSDIALHINPRLPQNYIVRNCYVKGSWGREEVAAPLTFNLHRGHRFALQILVTNEAFMICVNGRHCNSFKHRLPYRKICTLEVKGDVRDVAVDQCYMDSYPQLELEIVKRRTPEEQKEAMAEVKQLEGTEVKQMPYTGVLPVPFTNGQKLHIFGRIKLLPHSFYINLQTSAYVWPHPNILFHLNPRFGKVGGRHVICRNSWRNGKWEREERTDNPSDMQPGKPFHLQIECTDVAYQVLLNDKLISEFIFRDDPRLVEAVFIQGDIKLYDVVVETAY